jgi:hypothetical protein
MAVLPKRCVERTLPEKDALRMITDTEIKTKRFQVVAQYFGDIEAERFVAHIQSVPDEKFKFYTLCTREFTALQFTRIKEVREWLLHRINA